jgi:hypothetical protein
MNYYNDNLFMNNKYKRISTKENSLIMKLLFPRTITDNVIGG